MKTIFVFGSNLAGRHGAGAALEAAKNWGAQYGIGHGRTGLSYAIPTKDRGLRTLPLDVIEKFVREFIEYAESRPALEFKVTAIGTGLAGYSHEQIAPMFREAPKNCLMCDEWKRILGRVA